MTNLVSELCEIFEVSSLQMDVPFEDLPEWDSLNALSVLALLDSVYGIQLEIGRLHQFGSINEFTKYVLANKK
jgi:acyl carrier protein